MRMTSSFFSYLRKGVDLIVDGIVAFQGWLQQYPLMNASIAYMYTGIQGFVYGWQKEPAQWKSWICYTSMHELDEYMWNEGDDVYVNNLDWDLIVAKTADGRRGVLSRKEENIIPYVWHIPSVQTKCPFITVKYTAPSLNHYLGGLPYSTDRVEQYIDLGKEYFYVGNDLFSAAFIKRWFSYHGRVAFHPDYTIELLDGGAMKMVTIRSGQHIHLLENGKYLQV